MIQDGLERWSSLEWACHLFEPRAVQPEKLESPLREGDYSSELRGYPHSSLDGHSNGSLIRWQQAQK
jgi:hypothetical protein